MIPHLDSIFISMTNYSEFCPELILNNPTKATEQIMNALVLNNTNNITTTIKAVSRANHIYTMQHKKLTPLELVDTICLQIPDGGVTLAPYSYAANHNLTFKPQKTYQNYTQKQNLINLEFLTDYLVKFNGQKVTYLSSFFVMVEELMITRENNVCHSTEDSLIYDVIHPQCDDLRIDTRNIIYKELHKFRIEYEKTLTNNLTQTPTRANP